MPVRILLPDLTKDAWRRPASIPLLRTTTTLGLRGIGHEPVAGIDAPAEMALVDVLDAPSDQAREALGALRARGLPVILRLHGAWRGARDRDMDSGAGTAQALLDAADRVIVSSRSHLVRLASNNTLDPARVRLLAPPQPRFDASPTSRAGADAPRVLVIGDGDIDGLAAALPAAATLDSFRTCGTDAEATDSFSTSVRDADVVVLVARGPWSDRLLLQACVDLGRPVIAACGPVTGEELCRPGVFPIALDATGPEWEQALAAAISTGTRAAIEQDRTRGVIDRADRLRRLTAILFEVVAPAGDCFGRLTA